VSTYREIIGKKIKAVSSDPSSGTEGEMWYNSTTGTLRGPAIISAWTSSGPLISLQGDVANLGTQTASMIAGGSDNPGSENVDITQEGNGTGFSLGGTLNTARRGCSGFGTQTAGVCFGGYSTTYTNVTEEYNGTAWTNGNNTPISPGTASWCSGGTLTAGIGYTGSYLGPNPSSPNNSKQTIEYDGTNWADANQLTRPAGDGANGFGVQTAALCTGQSTITGSPSASTLVEEYDGTNWTSGTVTPTASSYGGSGGIQTAGMIFGGASDGSPGYPTKVTTTQSWNGTSWSVEPALATARMGTQGGPVGSNTASQLMGGSNGSTNLTNVENFDSSPTAITAGAWASGENLGTTRRGCAGAGTQTAALCIGGEPPRMGNTEKYDGTSWTESGDLNTARNQLASAGTQGAALAFGGEAPTPTNYTETETFNGSSWTEVADMSTARRGHAGFGSQTAAVAAAGFGPPGASTFISATEEWGGSSWTSATAMPTVTAQISGLGTQTAGIIYGGVIPPSDTKVTSSFEYDGTNWTTGGALLLARSEASQGIGTQTAGLVAGGNTPGPNTATSEGYDGTAFSTRPSMSVAKAGGSGLMSGSTSTAGLMAGGYTGTADTGAAEEFTGETSALNIEDFTTS